jgi:YD repeat-containing protein
MEKYTYDKKGRLLETLNYNPDGSFNRKSVRSYDERGRLTGTKFYGPEEEPDFTWTIKYDDYDNVVERSRYDRDLENTGVIYTNSYLYDETGNWIQKIEYKNLIPMYILEREIKYY